MLYQRENELALNTNGNRFNTIFAVCFKILDKPLKGILCNKCSSFINRKCSTWKTSEIRKTYKTKLNKTWDCVSYQQEKFSFQEMSDIELQKKTFLL